MVTVDIERERVLAFRLSRHQVGTRLPAGSLARVAGACGLRNTPPGSADIAAHARMSGLRPGEVDLALADRSLVQTWSLRGGPVIVPAADAGTFTAGISPRDDKGVLAMLAGFAPVLAKSAVAPMAALDEAADAVATVLDGKVMTKPELSAEATRRVRKELAPYCAGCGTEHISESLLRLVAVRGVICFVPREGNVASFTRLDRWLPATAPDVEVARVDLLRRYLRCYAPTTAKEFADWAGVSTADAKATWAALGDDLVEVGRDGDRAWALAADLTAFTAAAPPAGLRLLPPYDAVLDMRDRTTLLPDKATHRQVWRAIGNPGAVVHDGELVGAWRQRKAGKGGGAGAAIEVVVEPFASLPPPARVAVATEAEAVARLRGADAVRLTIR